ncbi:uncharacterized protein LOC120088181 isoform X1 [Benincasa hispida]|uniref:uncharacterized protein LOC120088181 isoform X1 n=1 Tax=Benincasa hispida TaxID=102211 RepID=UPI001901F8FD|nr:uncharacterized protein LOC120088181 isoform X1 [Benincasa hispida]
MKSKTKPHLIFLRYIFDVSSILNNVPSKASWPNESQLFRNGVTAIPKIGSYALPTYSMLEDTNPTLWRGEESHHPNLVGWSKGSCKRIKITYYMEISGASEL